MGMGTRGATEEYHGGGQPSSSLSRVSSRDADLVARASKAARDGRGVTAVLDTRLDADNGLHSRFVWTMRAKAEASLLTEETTTTTLFAAAWGVEENFGAASSMLLLN